MSVYSFSTQNSLTPTIISNITADIASKIASASQTAITYNESCITITFNNALSKNDGGVLYNIVSSHDTTPTIGQYQLSYSTNRSDITTSTYKQVFTITFPGARFITGITHIKISSFMDASGTSYTVRLFDVTNGTVIADGTFTNTEHIINDLENISNIPENGAVLELQCKVTGTTHATIRSLTIYYG